MEGESGFKECPRCGLRNRISAAKCDFCGYEFEKSTEEWSDYVDVLERLSKSDEDRAVDEETSKKIESTMIKSETIEELIVRKSERLDVTQENLSEIQRTTDQEMGGIEESTDEEESEDILAFVGSMIGPDTSESEPAIEEPDVNGAVEEEYAPTEDSVPEPEGPAESESVEGSVPSVEEDSQTGAVLVGEEIAEWNPSLEGRESLHERVGPGPEEAEEFDVIAIAKSEYAPSSEAEPMAEFHQTEPASNMPFLVCVSIGMVLYLSMLGLALMDALDPVIGWMAAITGALLVTIGFGRFHHPLPANDGGEPARGS
jgi:hypothetical protein